MSPTKLPLVLVAACCALFVTNPLLAQAEESPENILTEGDFSSVSGEFYSGWKPGGFMGGKPGTSGNWANKVLMETDDKGMPYVRVECADPDGADVGIASENITLNPAWTTLKVSGLMRVSNYQSLSEWGGRAQLSVAFLDSNSEEMPGDLHVGFSKDVGDWELVEKELMIPPGAASVSVRFGVLGANAVADIKDIKLSAQ